MKVGRATGFLISLVIVMTAGYLLLLSNIWYLVIFSGLIASLVIRRGYLVSLLSSFTGGVLVILALFLALPLGNLGQLMTEVGTISGIPSTLLITMIFLINAALALSGGLIGTFAGKTARMRKVQPNQ